MKDCYILKDKIQVLVEARVIQLKPEQKKITTNMTTFQVCALEVSASIMSILKVNLG